MKEVICHCLFSIMTLVSLQQCNVVEDDKKYIGRVFPGMEMNDTGHLTSEKTPVIHSCRHLCEGNVSCTALTYSSTPEGPTCKLHSGRNFINHLQTNPLSTVIIKRNKGGINNTEEIAQGKPCTSSSAYVGSHYTHCDYALDGSSLTRWNELTCFGTKSEKDPWWQVDLQGFYRIYQVTVLVRSDCCQERFDNIDVIVGAHVEEKESGQICQEGISSSTELTRHFRCNAPIYGRFVFLKREILNGNLEMCEVKVYGR